MTRSRALKSVALMAVTAAATSLAIQACGGGDAVAQSNSDVDAIEGVWDSAISIKDCTSGAPGPMFRGSSLFHHGGTLSGDNSMPVTSRGAAFGTWKRGTGSVYAANLWFTRYNPDGSVAGTQKVERSLTLAADGNSLSGTLTLQIISPSGAVVQQGCDTESGTRISWP